MEGVGELCQGPAGQQPLPAERLKVILGCVCDHPGLKIARSPCSRGPVFACRWKYSLCWMLLSVRSHVVYGDRWIPAVAAGLLGEIRTLLSTCRAQR